MEIKGRVIDENNGSGIPGATVEAWSGSVMLNRVAADNSGYFSLLTSSTPEHILITSAGVLPSMFTDFLQRTAFPVARSIIETGGVFIKSTIPKSSAVPWLIGLLAVFLLFAKKRI